MFANRTLESICIDNLSDVRGDYFHATQLTEYPINNSPQKSKISTYCESSSQRSRKPLLRVLRVWTQLTSAADWNGGYVGGGEELLKHRTRTLLPSGETRIPSTIASGGRGRPPIKGETRALKTCHGVGGMQKSYCGIRTET